MIVIVLLGSVYFIIFSTFNTKEVKKNISIENIKEYLLNNFKYEKELALSCIDSAKIECFVFVDKVRQVEITFVDFFKTIPLVYNYDRELSNYAQSKINIDDTEYETIFEIKIDSDKKHKDMVVEYNDKVYLITSIFTKIKRYKNTNELIDEFYKKEDDIKNAL